MKYFECLALQKMVGKIFCQAFFFFDFICLFFFLFEVVLEYVPTISFKYAFVIPSHLPRLHEECLQARFLRPLFVPASIKLDKQNVLTLNLRYKTVSQSVTHSTHVIRIPFIQDAYNVRHLHQGLTILHLLVQF